MNNYSQRAFDAGIDRPNRKFQPSVSIYFIRDDNDLPPSKISCLFCKRTLMDGVKGTVDKVVDGPVPADDHDHAFNIQCKLCGQMYRMLVNANFPVNLDKLVDAGQPMLTPEGWK
jgi:transcription elongation factor Elf1